MELTQNNIDSSENISDVRESQQVNNSLHKKTSVRLGKYQAQELHSCKTWNIYLTYL